MRFSSRIAQASVVAALASTAAAYIPASTLQTDILAAEGLLKLAINQTLWRDSRSCTLENVAIRREWTALSKAEQANYISAMQCMMNRPSQAQSDMTSGAASRYDDFVAVHINQTLTIHGTTKFLTWHRYFTWAWEQELRDYCGYTGYQPYWNWGKSAFDIHNSPYVDGSDYSMSGNGVYEFHNCTTASTGLPCIPAGAGGGCVDSGPFKNMSVNLGPVFPTLEEDDVVATATGLSYNPRCLKRDISNFTAEGWLKDSDSYDLLMQEDITDFQNMMQGNFTAGFFGVHTAGHFSYGNGDPGGDIFASPGDPAFWIHHGQIDRTYWIWQNQNLAKRQFSIGGTITLLNSPPSRDGQLNDTIYVGNLNSVETIEIYDAMSTMAGPFCYIYL